MHQIILKMATQVERELTLSMIFHEYWKMIIGIFLVVIGLLLFGFLKNIKSKKELSVQNKNEIIEMVKAKYKAPLKISYDINKELISGFIIRVNSDIYDTSVKSKLDQIRQLEVA